MIDPTAPVVPAAATTMTQPAIRDDDSTSARRRRAARLAVDAVSRYAKLSALTTVVFAALFVVALAFINSSPHVTDPDAVFTAFYSSGNTALVTTGLYLVPFAGITFLWSMTALRQLITAITPVPNAMPFALQLIGGVLFVALLFAGMAAAGGQALLTQLGGTAAAPVEVTRSFLVVGYGLVFVYAVRGAGMYVTTTTTLLLRAGLLPKWVAVLSYLAATFMLISTTLNPVAVLMLPAWAVLVGAVLLVRGQSTAQQAGQQSPSGD